MASILFVAQRMLVKKFEWMRWSKFSSIYAISVFIIIFPYFCDPLCITSKYVSEATYSVNLTSFFFLVSSHLYLEKSWSGKYLQTLFKHVCVNQNSAALCHTFDRTFLKIFIHNKNDRSVDSIFKFFGLIVIIVGK